MKESAGAYARVLVSAILAGVCIGMGGVVYLSVENKVAGAALFTVGLFVICIFGFNLFTGKVCYVFQNDIKYAIRLPIIWVGNLIGTWLIAFLISFTRNTAVAENAKTLCGAKMGDTYLSLFILGIWCDVLIYVAVEGFLRCQHEAGKYLALFFGVMVFILSGYEHCVADMFYFSAAKIWSGDAFVRILVISLGNAVGGVMFPLIRSWLARS